MRIPENSPRPRAARIGPGGAELSADLQQCETDGGEAGPFPVGDVLQRQAVLFIPGAPLPHAGGRVLGTAKPPWAPVDGVLGQQVNDVSGWSSSGCVRAGRWRSRRWALPDGAGRR